MMAGYAMTKTEKELRERLEELEQRLSMMESWIHPLILASAQDCSEPVYAVGVWHPEVKH